MANLNIENPNFSTAEREARQGKSTIYRQLLDMGFTHEEIEAQAKVEANTQEIFLNFNQSEHGGDPMIGIGYNPDHRYEEESGIGKIIETIHSDARNDRFMGKSTIKTDKGEFEVYAVLNNTDDNSYVVSKLTREMNDTLKRHLNPYSRYITTYSNVLKIRDMSVSELRAELKGKVVPLPKRLQDLQDAYAETILGVPVKRTTDAGNLSSGQFLTMMTANPILKAILNILFTDTVAQNQIATASLATLSLPALHSMTHGIFQLLSLNSGLMNIWNILTKWKWLVRLFPSLSPRVVYMLSAHDASIRLPLVALLVTVITSTTLSTTTALPIRMASTDGSLWLNWARLLLANWNIRVSSS